MDGPIYHLERVVKVKTEDLEDFMGPGPDPPPAEQK